MATDAAASPAQGTFATSKSMDVNRQLLDGK
jgi:hypothetical protein